MNGKTRRNKTLYASNFHVLCCFSKAEFDIIFEKANEVGLSTFSSISPKTGSFWKCYKSGKRKYTSANMVRSQNEQHLKLSQNLT
jgi:hypothetical protein